MFKNYLIIALRNLWKRKQFSGIVLFGLATASAACVLLLLTAFRELSFDRFHEHENKLYRTYWEFFRTRGTEYTANMPAPLLPALKTESDAIAYATRWHIGVNLNLTYIIILNDWAYFFAFHKYSSRPLQG